MLKIAFNRYINNFKGFSREIWILTIITFINRAGTMVLPFLSKYLKEDLGFDYDEIGTILMCFGGGSLLGSWLGGKLSDKIGFYRIMIFSLLVSGLGMFLLVFIKSFIGLCIGMFVLMSIADMFRPAMFVSLGAYAKPENRTRALTLVRLAINLGFAAGPALGGLIIMGVGYEGLFWVDGTSCIIAILVFWILVKEKKKSSFQDKKHPGEVLTTSVFRDKPFWLFLATCLITGILFFQLFNTIPLYHKEQFGLTEFQTGLLLTMNGILIFFLEMPIVSYVERKNIDKVKVVSLGCLLMAISFFLLLFTQFVSILIIMMVFMTFAEMFSFPFSNSVALSRAPKGHEGRYMAIYTMSFSLAHILSPKIGMEMIDNYSYFSNWLLMGIIGVIGTILGILTYQLILKEQTKKQLS
ncbi:MAG TPA: MFS transporter [Flavobacterium sp.]|nr:MFS transporter [Flavobacterium sp.]